MLEKLILSIIDCEIDESVIERVAMIIMDNDQRKTAESTVINLMEKFGAVHELYYYYFPVKGLSNVRNEMIKKGLELNPDFLVFIDDDEYVSAEWLNELVKNIVFNNGDMTMGPVRSVVSEKIPDNVSCWLDRDDYPDNTRLKFIRTGNLIIRVSSILQYKISFDVRFNLTGGEDSYFGVQMIRKGASIFWASKAVAWETVPDDRANIKWILKRHYNGANKYAYILKIEHDRMKILRKFLISILYMILGICASVFTLVPFRKRYWGILKLAEGFGGVAGFLSLRYAAYR